MLIRLIVLFLYPYDVKLMSMSLSLNVNFVSHRQFGLFSFSSVFVSIDYIVHYLCLISPHGLAALAGDIKID